MNSMTVIEQKQECRARLKAALAGITAEEAREAGQDAWSLLRERREWLGARKVFLYCSMVPEVDTLGWMAQVLQQGKELFLPRYVGSTGGYEAARLTSPSGLGRGAFGILEPGAGSPSTPWNQLDFALVPGLGFTPDGRRIGRGKGHYDRILPHILGPTCGLGHDLQIVADLPVEPHDCRLDYLLTPSRWVACGPRGDLTHVVSPERG